MSEKNICKMCMKLPFEDWSDLALSDSEPGDDESDSDDREKRRRVRDSSDSDSD